MQIRKFAGLLAAACLALAAFGASSAMAEEKPAKFSASSIKLSTSGVTVEKSGGDPKVCTMKTYGPASGKTVGSAIFAYNWWNGFTTRLDCPSSTELTLSFYGAQALYDTGSGKYKVRFNAGTNVPFYTPWGEYIPDSYADGVWNNGSGATPSTLSLDHEPIGELVGGGAKITLTGTFTATTSTGGLLTLSP